MSVVLFGIVFLQTKMIAIQALRWIARRAASGAIQMEGGGMRILLDMDGVLADFVGATLEVFDKRNYVPRKWNYFEDWGITEDEFWRHISGTSRFWEGIWEYDNAPVIVDLCEALADEVRISTAPALDPNCIPGKLEWLKQRGYFGRLGSPMLGPHKHLMASYDSLLIDDKPENCSAFREHGGWAILYPQPWNSEAWPRNKTDWLSREISNVRDLMLAGAAEGPWAPAVATICKQTEDRTSPESLGSMSRSEVSEVMDRVFDECRELRNAGQKEYAHDDSNAFANFERVAERQGLTREQVLLTYSEKHIDGIHSYVQGHKSQRESVKGRINDLIVYMCILRGMVECDEREESTTCCWT